MKKKVKALIIAASVAAIAGIGAVSFAAWNAGDVEDQTANGSTATIVTTAGEIKVENNNLSDSVKLLPWDQVVQIGSNKKMQTFDVSYDAQSGAAASDYTFTMALTNTANLPLYYQIGTVDANALTDPTAEGSQWTQFTGEVELDLTSTQTVNIVLVSTNAQYEAHKNQSYTITISAEAK